VTQVEAESVRVAGADPRTPTRVCPLSGSESPISTWGYETTVALDRRDW